jgi:hypothetical protein
MAFFIISWDNIVINVHMYIMPGQVIGGQVSLQLLNKDKTLLLLYNP